MLILFLLGSHKIFVASLVDPFIVDRIIFHQHSSTDSTSKFYVIHVIQRCLWWFYIFGRYCEKYYRVCSSCDQSILNRVFNVFLLIKTIHLLYGTFSSSDLKHKTSFWCLFSLDFICNQRRLLLIGKKYTNTNGKDSKYTNAKDISLTGSCGGGPCSAGGRGSGDAVSDVDRSSGSVWQRW